MLLFSSGDTGTVGGTHVSQDAAGCPSMRCRSLHRGSNAAATPPAQSTPCRSTVSDSPPRRPCRFQIISRKPSPLYPLTRASLGVAAGANAAVPAVASVDSEGSNATKHSRSANAASDEALSANRCYPPLNGCWRLPGSETTLGAR